MPLKPCEIYSQINTLVDLSVEAFKRAIDDIGNVDFYTPVRLNGRNFTLISHLITQGPDKFKHIEYVLTKSQDPKALLGLDDSHDYVNALYFCVKHKRKPELETLFNYCKENKIQIDIVLHMLLLAHACVDVDANMQAYLKQTLSLKAPSSEHVLGFLSGILEKQLLIDKMPQILCFTQECGLDLCMLTQPGFVPLWFYLPADKLKDIQNNGCQFDINQQTALNYSVLDIHIKEGKDKLDDDDIEMRINRYLELGFDVTNGFQKGEYALALLKDYKKSMPKSIALIETALSCHATSGVHFMHKARAPVKNSKDENMPTSVKHTPRG